jgi:hypothetical protein
MVRCNLWLSKTRVAKIVDDPEDDASISKKELMAATLGAALIKFIKEHFPLNFTSISLKIDSSCVMGWLNSTENLGRYIENRKRFIFSIVEIITHIRTDDNAADDASRGCSMLELISNKRWWHGPSWLLLPESEWPPYAVPPVHRPTNYLEEKQLEKVEATNAGDTVTLAAPSRRAKILTFIETERFSKWDKLISVVAAFLFFVKRCGKNISSPFMDSLRAVCADRYFDMQMYVFELGLTEEKLLVCNHRIPTETAPPLIWLPECFEVNKYILFLHEKLNHAGPRHVLNELRAKYWLCRGKQVIMKVLRHECYHCRRNKARPYELPKMPPLPKERVEVADPFQYVGVDFCGPFDVKIKIHAEGPAKEYVQKTWICLFTCFVTRNVHLEICQSMDGPTFVNAFRRFTARFTCPSVVWSDNGTNFVAAKKFIEPAWTFKNSSNVAQLIRDNKIKWNFITEKSPWKGGLWERLIGLVKINLRHAIGRRILNIDEFHTFVSEVESIVNSRPITPVDNEFDPNSTASPLALRPVDFINPYYHPTTPKVDPEYNSDPDFLLTQSTESKLRLLYQKTASLRQSFSIDNPN